MSEVQLPEGWVWKKLGEIISEAQVGIVKSSSEQNTNQQGVPYLKMNNIDLNGSTSSGDMVYVEASVAEIQKYSLCDGDLLFNTRNSFELVGKTGIVKNITHTVLYNNNLLRLRFKREVEPYYINYQMVSPAFRRELTTGKKATTNICAIYQKDLLSLNVVIPPLPVQHQIVARIEELFSELDAGVKELKTALVRLKTYRQAVLHHYLNNPDWERVKLGEVILLGPQNGLYKPQNLYGSGTRIVRIDNFYDGVLNPEKSFRRVQIEATELTLYKINEGDVLVNRVNSMTHLGKCAFVKGLTENTVFESNIMRFVLNPEVTNTRFIVHFLTSSLGLKELRKNAKQAVNQASINQQDVKGVELYLPDLATQTQIVLEIESRLSESDAMETTIRQELARAENLRQSILKQAFSGKLVTAPVTPIPVGELAEVSEPVSPFYGSPSGDQLTLF